MPLTITGERLDQRIEILERKLNSPDLILALGSDLASALGDAYESSGLRVVSGAGIRALTYIGEPERSGNGWTIGVGDRGALGDEGDPAPRGVLRQFQEDNGLRPSPWKYMLQSYKDKLETMRRSGMYGGRGPLYANYMWVQDQGNATAYITGRNLIDNGVSVWRSRADDIVSEWWESLGTFGRFKRSIAGIFGR